MCFIKVKLFVLLLRLCAILPGKAIPKMTYTVSGGTLHHTHSIRQLYAFILRRICSVICNKILKRQVSAFVEIVLFTMFEFNLQKNESSVHAAAIVTHFWPRAVVCYIEWYFVTLNGILSSDISVCCTTGSTASR